MEDDPKEVQEEGSIFSHRARYDLEIEITVKVGPNFKITKKSDLPGIYDWTIPYITWNELGPMRDDMERELRRAIESPPPTAL